jgi:putative acetyltransferase
MRVSRDPREVTPRGPNDAPALLQLWLAAWRATYDDIDFGARSEWFMNHLQELEARGALTLCLHEGAPPSLGGFVVVDPATGWLDQLCVLPRYFGTGIAHDLLAAAQRVAPAALRLDVNADNRRALRFYERQGFVRVGPGAPSRSGRATLVLERRAPTLCEDPKAAT